MEKIAEVLDKRHKERRTRFDHLHELKHKETPLNEDIEHFESVFDEKVREIQNNLNNLEGGDKSLTNVFSKIGQNIHDLQKFLSSSTFFLNDRKVQKCQEIINDLLSHLETRKSQLVPKKKFGFKNRSKEIQIKKEDNISKNSSNEISTTLTCNDAYRQNSAILLTSIESNEKDLTIANMKNCVLQIEGHPGSLHLKNISNCIIVAGPISRSVFGDNCCACIIAVACQQLRLHNSKQCDTYLHVSSRGIIEDSCDIRVAPYNYNYSNIEADYKATNLPMDKNNWDNLADFNWLSTEQKSPNWKIIPEKDRIMNWDKSIQDFKEKHICIDH